MFKRKLGVLSIILLFVVILSACGAQELEISEEDIKTVGESLVLISHKDKYSEIIDELPEFISDNAKFLLKQDISIEYDKNNRYDYIEKPLVGILDITSVSDIREYTIVVSFQENGVFQNLMTTVIRMKHSEGKVYEVEVNSYTNNFKHIAM